MEIVPGIHQVDGVNGNSYLIVRDGITVIDTGIPGSGKKILAYIREKLHRQPTEIQTIIITHFHMDHTGGVAALKRAAPDARVAVGREDAAYLTGRTPLPVYPGIRGILLRIAGMVMHPAAIRPDILLEDGDLIAALRCIHIPGHTPGSIGLLDEQTGAFFAGDILRYDGASLAEGPAGFTMDLEGSRQSIRTIALLSFTILLPGHGIPLREDAAGKVRAFIATLPSPDKEST
jgi:glyoxylase-like metal-dependent hydrolase (beta-lactamase superfamily II)